MSGSCERSFGGAVASRATPAIHDELAALMETREVMGMREASEYMGVSRETLYKYLNEGRIPGFKLGNRWKFKKTVLDRWMEAQSGQESRLGTGEGSRRP